MITTFSLIEVFNDPKNHFRGNIAAVVSLKEALTMDLMQEIAEDLNQPATAFIHPVNGASNEYHIRWFAPDCEIGLCGHGSLAAVASFTDGSNNGQSIRLHYPNGIIEAVKHDNSKASISLAPILVTEKLEVTPELEEGFGKKVLEHYKTTNKDIVVLENESAVQSMVPNYDLLRKLDHFGYSVTAKGDEVDFVSRTILPFVKVLEDPATGSAHAALTPFWSERLSKTEMTAHQLSSRGGKFFCEIYENNLSLTGQYKFLAEGQLSINT